MLANTLQEMGIW